MNPADFGMFWMNQYAQAQERMIIDDSTNYYTQPTIGMSVMDDIGHQTSTMVSRFQMKTSNSILIHKCVDSNSVPVHKLTNKLKFRMKWNGLKVQTHIQ